MSKILVVYHSFSGKTKQLAEIVAAGVKSAGAQAVVKGVAEASIDDFAGVDGLFILTPTTFGSYSGETKAMFDRLWMHKAKLTPKLPVQAVVFCGMNPGSTVADLEKLTGIFGFAKVGEWPVFKGAEFETAKERCHQLGSEFAIGAY
jgi:multimeric flavodoxin WrbA